MIFGAWSSVSGVSSVKRIWRENSSDLDSVVVFVQCIPEMHYQFRDTDVRMNTTQHGPRGSLLSHCKSSDDFLPTDHVDELPPGGGERSQIHDGIGQITDSPDVVS